MSISILGAGNVGMALGQAFTQRGKTVVCGVPDPAKYQAAVAALDGNARVTTNEEAIGPATPSSWRCPMRLRLPSRKVSPTGKARC